MDKLNISATGYPLTNDTARALNEMSKHPTEALAASLGQFTIISGVVDDGTNLSAGYITYDGELLPFIAGASQPNIEVVEVVTDGFYDDGTTVAKPVRTVRYAQGTANGAARPISDFKRLTSQDELAKLKNVGTIAISFISGATNNVSFTGEILNVEREIYLTDNIRYKITVPERLVDYIPVLISTTLLASEREVIIGNITTTSFTMRPAGLRDNESYVNSFNLYIID
jgi:hypothetical protein